MKASYPLHNNPHIRKLGFQCFPQNVTEVPECESVPCCHVTRTVE